MLLACSGIVAWALFASADEPALTLHPAKEATPSAAAQAGPQLGFLGVRLAPTEDETPGALIAEIVAGLAAEKSALKVGDILFVVDGQPTNTPAEVSEEISRHKPGTQVPFKVDREGQTLEIAVTIGGRPLLVETDPPRVQGGLFSNAGSLHGSLDNSGNYVVAGTPTRQVGDFKQRVGGLICFTILGKEKNTSTRIHGDVQLGGAIHIALEDYSPRGGEAYELIHEAKRIHGQFDFRLLPPLPDGLR